MEFSWSATVSYVERSSHFPALTTEIEGVVSIVAANRIDLLSLAEREIGHTLGLLVDNTATFLSR